MEVIKRYPQIDDMISALTRTANNLDKLLEIMTTANEIGKKEDEIQDLKLENDRLKQRDAIMLRFITSLCCSGETCSRDCDLYFEWNDHDCCALLHPKELDHVASDILKKLEEL